jgi:hypothetical protein
MLGSNYLIAIIIGVIYCVVNTCVTIAQIVLLGRIVKMKRLRKGFGKPTTYWSVPITILGQMIFFMAWQTI